jgi:protein-disulfide isomerase/uncharacterized membrane protein
MNQMKKNWLFLLAAMFAVCSAGLYLLTPYDQWVSIPGLLAALAVGAGVCFHSLRLGIATTALVCAASNGFLLSQKLFPAKGSSICKINEWLNCKAAISSEYATIFADSSWETPITLPGLAFFTALAGASLFSVEKTPRFFQVSAFFGIFNILVSLYLASALVVEGAACVFCVSIYLGNIIILVASFKGMSTEKVTLFAGFGATLRSNTLSNISFGFVLLVIGGKYGIGAASTDAPSVSDSATADEIDVDSIRNLYNRLPGKLFLDGTEPVAGKEDAPYTIVEFADYTCPHCAMASAELKELLAEFDDIQLKFKVYPLSAECNPQVPRKGIAPCTAAIAAECGHQQGMFYEISNALFTNQSGLSENNWNMNDIEFLAQDQGLDLEAFRTCFRDENMIDGVLADANAGNQVGIRGTPTILVHGVTGDEWLMLNEPNISHLKTLFKAHRKGAELISPNASPERNEN